jgi:hypothetical protein
MFASQIPKRAHEISRNFRCMATPRILQNRSSYPYDFHHAVLGGVNSFDYKLCDTGTMCPPAPRNVSHNEVTEISASLVGYVSRMSYPLYEKSFGRCIPDRCVPTPTRIRMLAEKPVLN